MDLSALRRFVGSKDEFKLSKIGSKRKDSQVGVGQYEIGDFDLLEFGETESGKKGSMVLVCGRGFNYLRTSPVVKIVDQDEDSTAFETEGGVYRVERYKPKEK